LLDLPAGEASQIVRQQSYIVEHEPERALATLPMLVRPAEERRRLLGILERLADNIELAPEQRTLIPEFRRLLAPEPIPERVPAAIVGSRSPRRQARGSK